MLVHPYCEIISISQYFLLCFRWGILWLVRRNIAANFLGRLSIVIFPSKSYLRRPTQSPPSGTWRARPDSPAQARRANLPNKHLNETVKSKQSRWVQEAVILYFSWSDLVQKLEKTSKLSCPDYQQFFPKWFYSAVIWKCLNLVHKIWLSRLQNPHWILGRVKGKLILNYKLSYTSY